MKNVLPADRERVPAELCFDLPNLGKVKIVLTHRYKMRHCYYCGKWHDAICEIRNKSEEIAKEKAAMAERKAFGLKICGDSTVRYVNDVAVEGVVEAMSGATTGNILNSLEVDDDRENVKQIVMVTGSNERKSNLTAEEYLYTLKIIRERVALMMKDEKEIAMVPPPKAGFLSPEEQVREEAYEKHLQGLKAQGVKIWENPLKSYDEDFGQHPSPEQSVTLCTYMHKKATEDFAVGVLMKSASDDVIALPNKYRHVTSLYRYGCAACASKARNKWYNICDICKEAAVQDEEIKKEKEWYDTRLKAIMDEENPSLPSDSDDDLKCVSCQVVFQEVNELRRHLKEAHPDSDGKIKRPMSQQKEKDKKGRRTKNNPNKSLDGSRK